MMRFSTLLRHPARWMTERGEDGDVAVSSRIRLARNLAKEPFPGWSKKADRQRILAHLDEPLRDLSMMKEPFYKAFDELDKHSRQVLVERHLISRELAARNGGSAVMINREQSLSVMVNEEDHLRLQAITPGFQLDEAMQIASKNDDELAQSLDLAVDSRFGYLTACPTNTGTGMRASVMLHLPGLAMMDQMGQVVQGVQALNMAVRGLYGEGSDALGNLFQVSNQVTLGLSEQEIVERLQRTVRHIIRVERLARQNLLETRPGELMDGLGRAYGLLKHAWRVSSVEALNNLSLLRLGAELELVDKKILVDYDLLLLTIQPAQLQWTNRGSMAVTQRDELRASLLRDKLAELPAPYTRSDL